MAKEDLNPQEEESQEDSKPTEERDSEETSEEDASTEESDESTDSNKEIESLKKELNDLKKGVHKAFSEQGQKKKEQPEPSQSNPSYAEDLLLVRFPEAENVLKEAKEFAQEQGTDVLTVFKNSTFLQSEAKTRAELKKKEDEAKSKINGSSSQIGDGNLSFEDVDLSNPEHKKWLNAKKERKERFKKWFSQKVN